MDTFILLEWMIFILAELSNGLFLSYQLSLVNNF